MCVLKSTRGATFAFFILVSTVSVSLSSDQKNITIIPSITIRQAASGASESCVCVPYYYCNADNVLITNGDSLIDVRQNSGSATEKTETGTTCANYLEICCRLPEPSTDSAKCGLRRNHGPDNIPRLDHEEAGEGEFPWMVTIFRTKTVQVKNETKEIKVYQCQGTLIHERVVLTAAQCIQSSGNTCDGLSIRAGQLDTMMTIEETPYQENIVKEVVLHKRYNPNKLQNNVALLVLQKPVIKNKNVDITCLGDHSDVIDESKCLVIGWDKFLNPEDALFQRSQINILKRRVESYVSKTACTALLRNTPLGRRFKLDNSSVCAGGSESKNFCSREVGGPLACPLRNEPARYVQVGIASWCISFGNYRTPSIFANVLQVRGWIDNQMARLNLDSSIYRAPK